MKTKFLFLIALLFAINNFAQDTPCGTVVDHTFDVDGTLPEGWTEYNTSGRVTVDSGKLKFNHNTTKPSVYHTFSPVTNNASFSFDVSASRSSVNCQIHLVSSTGKYLSSIAVGVKTASIKYATSISSGVPSGFTDGTPLVSFKTNTTYSVSAEVDFTSKTVAFYGNGALMATDIPFLEAAEDIAKIDIQLIYMYANNGQFYFDNFSLLSGAANRLLLTTNNDSATTLINAASIGTNYDQYPQAAVDAFQQAIDNANTVLDDCDSASNIIDDAITNLQSAQDAFIAARINGLVLSLKNNTGIIEDNLGSVIRWENQVEGYGDATQSNTALGGDILYETYPGKVNVGFSKDGSFLELEDTSALVADNSYSVFYVGKGSPTERQAALIGNFNINGAWGDSSGARFVKNPEGVISMQYGNPSLQTEIFSTVPKDGFFFFGFTMDSSGNYKYFDNTSPIIKVGTLSKIIKTNTDNFKLNLYEDIDGPKTYAHTEVVELSMYDGKLSDLDFQDQFTRLSTEFADLVIGEFSVTEVLPAQRTNLPITSSITITCDQAIEPTSVFPKIYINKSETEATGDWVISPSNTLTFTPSENWPYKALVTVKIGEGLKSTDEVSIDISKGTKYNFIVETDEDFGVSENIAFTSIATVDFPQAGHTLGLKLNLPTNRTEKIPVHFWIHGGGWSGGTAAASAGSYSPHGEYLAENLGIATLGVGYRCSGSSGTFSLAMDDLAAAYQWALDNADTYNFDMTKVFFSGGSAGTPLAALTAQKYDGVIGFIGFNGIYDFVNDAGDFGVGNWYKQNVPSETANSPIFQLRTPPPATIMMHGDADTTISHTQSTLFADAINAKGGDAEAVIYPGEVHAFFNPGKPAYEDVLIEMVGFMNRILNEQSLSTIDISSDDSIIMYPNPVKKGDTLTLQLNSKFNSEKLEVQIINYLGQTVLKTTFYPNQDSNTIKIDTKNLKKGIYILKTLDQQRPKALKFVIQ
jgi:acetyl esterase/lipase